MNIEIKLNSNVKEPKITIETSELNEEIENIITIFNNISKEQNSFISGFIDDKVELIEKSKIISIYSTNGKVFALTENKEYRLKTRLYELENILDKKMFVRISNSEIINLKMVDSLDLSFTGTIYIKFLNGRSTYVSRRYVKKIKEILYL